MLVRLEKDRICVGQRFSFTLQRTVLLPDDGREYPLPPGFGAFPTVELRSNAFLVPIYEREALWFEFEAAPWKPNSVQVAAGGINAISGGVWPEPPSDKPQNYAVCPRQPWLDGINSLHGSVQQFVATASGKGDTIAEQLGGTASSGLQVRVYEPKAGRFPDKPPARSAMLLESPACEMGVGAGATIRQKIYPDPYGVDTWDPEKFADVHLFLVDPEQFREITGQDPPASPISAKTYADLGLPFFELQDHNRAAIGRSRELGKVSTLSERDRLRGETGKVSGLDIPGEQVRKGQDE